MKEKTIKKLIRLVEESDIDVLEVSSWGRKIRITRRMSGVSSGNGENPAVNHRAIPTAPAQVPTTPGLPMPSLTLSKINGSKKVKWFASSRP